MEWPVIESPDQDISAVVFFSSALSQTENKQTRNQSQDKAQLSAAPAMPGKSPSCVTFSLSMLQCTTVNGVHPRWEGELLAKAAFRDTAGSHQAKTESNSQGQPEQ